MNKRDQYQETFDTWDGLAQLYQEHFMHLKLYDDSYDQFCKKLPSADASILEIGCGPGNISNYILGKSEGSKLHGIDVSPNMIALARLNNPSATYEVKDCRKMCIKKAAYDGVICGFVIPYLSPLDCDNLMVDLVAQLKYGGVLYLSYVEGKDEDSGFVTGSGGARTYFYYHQTEKLVDIMRENNFHEVQVFKVNYPRSNGEIEIHTILIATKRRLKQ